MWGNTHFSMFSFFGPEKRKPKTRDTPQGDLKTIKSHHTYLNKNIQNWAETLLYLPINFYRYPFSTLCGVVHTVACCRSSALKNENWELTTTKTLKLIVSQ